MESHAPKKNVLSLRMGPPRVPPKVLRFSWARLSANFSRALKFRVAQELEQRAVELICARLGDDVDVPAGFSSEFRRVVGRLNTDLLDGIDRGRKDVGLVLDFFAHQAVEDVLVVFSALPVHGEGALPRAPRRLVADVVPRFDYARRKQRELHEIARGKRQIHNLLVLHQRADLRVRGLQQRGGSRDLHLLRDVAQFQSQVDVDHLVHVEFHRLRYGLLETGPFGRDRVVAYQKVGKRITARFVGGRGARHACAHLRERHRGARHSGVRGVQNDSGNAGSHLAEQQRCGRNGQKQETLHAILLN
jgi:hypothetical protein